MDTEPTYLIWSNIRINRYLKNSISIIIPFYNGHKFIERTISSVSSQTFLPNEIIIIDDGSDPKFSIESLVLDVQIPIKLLTQKNSGQAAARNAGAEISSSEFLVFLDQDDYWQENHLKKLFEEINKDVMYGWVYSDFNTVNDEQNILQKDYIQSHNLNRSLKSLSDFLTQDLMMLPSATLIRKKAFMSVGGFDSQFVGYEDDDVFVRLFLEGWSFSHVSESSLSYTVHSDNSSSMPSFQLSRQKFFHKYSSMDRLDERSKNLLVKRIRGSILMDVIICYRKGENVTDLSNEMNVLAQADNSINNKIFKWLIPKKYLLLTLVNARRALINITHFLTKRLSG